MNKENKEELVPYNNGYFYKDKEGVVWQILKTPYEEIPIKIFKCPERIEEV